MPRAVAIIGAVLLVGAMAALIVPMWIATAGMDLPPAALGAIALMIVGCFGVGGALMFLIFFSARRGYDDAVHHGFAPGHIDRRNPDGQPGP